MNRAIGCLAACTLLATLATPVGAQTGLTLSDALQRALKSNPEILASRQHAEAARARVRDSGRWANPKLSLSLENLDGDLGLDRTESTVELEQLFELGGDRSAREGLSGSLESIAWAEASTLERAVMRETAARFLETWSLQERTRRLRDAERDAEIAVTAARERHRAGAAPAHESVRAQGFRSMRAVERSRAETEWGSARHALALQWGASDLDSDRLVLDPPDTASVPSEEALARAVGEHPDRRRALAEIAVEDWKLREVRAARVPDLTVSAGVRHLAEIEATGLVAGVSLPLPLWNGMGGLVSAAERDQAAARERARFIELRVAREIGLAQERYESAAESWRRLRAEVIPSSREALDLVQNAYRGGRLTYVEILDTQRNLLEAELALIQAEADLWRAAVELTLLVRGPSTDGPKEDGR